MITLMLSMFKYLIPTTLFPLLAIHMSGGGKITFIYNPPGLIYWERGVLRAATGSSQKYLLPRLTSCKIFSPLLLLLGL
jgi:hypothetical protein